MVQQSIRGNPRPRAERSSRENVSSGPQSSRWDCITRLTVNHLNMA